MGTVNYTNIVKVDRCTSCHLGIDKVGYENAEQPYTSHPALEYEVDDLDNPGETKMVPGLFAGGKKADTRGKPRPAGSCYLLV